MNAARQVADAAGMGGAVDQVMERAQGAGFDLNARDFPAARGEGGSAGTRINAEHVSLDNAAEALSRSRYEMSQTGPVHVITPMVMPKGGRLTAMLPVLALAALGVVGLIVLIPFGMSFAVFGPHYWLLVLLAAAFLWWRQGMVMVPEGCTALISRFGKVEAEVGPGRVTLWNPWKRVSYIVNTTREYPFNAPIRSAPTKSGVQASVDLFLQFRIVSAREFVFVLGAVQGFQDKLNNTISETTRSLIYEQEASGIYDLVGESTARLLEQLNAQFAPAVELTTANITHAEPSAQEYRMDLAAPEMIRVAKEAYTYDYELGLKKEQNEGDLNKDLASLNENLSAIQADIARYQAQMDTALERETNRANAVARQRFVESESEANANAALLEAQALDIRALSAALAPEILDYRYQQDMLDKMEGVSGSLPQIVRVGEESEGVDYLQIARQLVGGQAAQLFTPEDMEAIRARQADIASRVAERESEITDLLQAPEETDVEILPISQSELDAEGEQRLDEIRQSVSDEAVAETLGAVDEGAAPPPSLPEDTNPRTDLQDEGEDPPPPPPGTAPPGPAAPPAPPAPRVAPAPRVQVTDMSTEGERSE
ncbi:SPFH domain-containing protein [Janibacter indicus]|uniref:SPFH domain-containing protein n=2 Tax=Janibacter indicus TaxID=857417 RepID=A0A7L9J5F0_9MICO|nr:SPFH domain-containing protein [Janibacter indicus]